MKKLILILTICLIASAVTAQQWAPTGAKWHYTEWFAFSGDIDYLAIESVGDTVIQGVNCSILEKRHNIVCSDRPRREYMYSTGGQVFFWDSAFNTFQMLYNFDATIGESWYIVLKDYNNPADLDSVRITVDSTGMTMINGIPKKQLGVNYTLLSETIPGDNYHGTLVESIGDMAYMFNYLPEIGFVCDANGSGGLRCYQDSLVGLYETGIADSCTYVYNWIPGSCQAYFSWQPDSLDNTVDFTDHSTGNINSWMWTFGDGDTSFFQNPSHQYANPGLYSVCLTVRGVDSVCFSTYCDSVVVTTPECPNYFNYQVVNLTASFSGHLTNGGDASYYWDFGDGETGTGANVTHTYSLPSWYTVTLATITTDSCKNITSQTLSVGDTAQYHQVWGQVFAGSFPLTTGEVMIFSVDSTLNYFPYSDVSTIDSMGIYYFSYVPDGNYYIWAIPENEEYLPTYYGDAPYWENATLITLGEPENPYNINLIPAIGYSPGNGNINGTVTGSKTLMNFVDKISMLIRDDNGNVLGHSEVDINGQFVFGDLALGTYYLIPELPGCNSDIIPVTLTASEPDKTINLTYNNGSILGVRNAEELVNSFLIYPSPARENVNVSIDLKKETVATMNIFDISGRNVSSGTIKLNQGSNTTSISLSNLQPGSYVLNLNSKDGMHIREMIIRKP